MSDENMILFTITPDEAREMADGMADFLCWARGFEAARIGTDIAGETPMGIEAIRRAKMLLERGLSNKTTDKKEGNTIQ